METESRILAVDASAIADHATVPAAPTWQRIGELLALGIPKYKLARALGSKAERAMPSLQIRRDRVLAKTARRVELFHRRFAAALLREVELRETFANAAELGEEFFAKESFSIITRKSALKAA